MKKKCQNPNKPGKADPSPGIAKCLVYFQKLYLFDKLLSWPLDFQIFKSTICSTKKSNFYQEWVNFNKFAEHGQKLNWQKSEKLAGHDPV